VRCAQCERYAHIGAMKRAEQLQFAAEVERRIGLPHGTLRERRRSGGGPRFYKVGPRTVLYETEVRAWLERSARVPSGTTAASAAIEARA
jgi:hypothetical protein